MKKLSHILFALTLLASAPRINAVNFSVKALFSGFSTLFKGFKKKTVIAPQETPVSPEQIEFTLQECVPPQVAPKPRTPLYRRTDDQADTSEDADLKNAYGIIIQHAHTYMSDAQLIELCKARVAHPGQVFLRNHEFVEIKIDENKELFIQNANELIRDLVNTGFYLKYVEKKCFTQPLVQK